MQRDDLLSSKLCYAFVACKHWSLLPHCSIKLIGGGIEITAHTSKFYMLLLSGFNFCGTQAFTCCLIKWWIGNVVCHGKYASVFAKLILLSHDSKGYSDMGVHAFIVPIKDLKAHKVHHGIEIQDCDHKIDLNGMDNVAGIGFSSLSFPKDYRFGNNHASAFVLRSGLVHLAPRFLRDRERAQVRTSKQKKNEDGLTPEQRRERDAKALQEKTAKKAASASGDAAGGKTTKK
ncbi:hypothetical protein V2J09_014361 [Rumex salicifolius]